MATPRVRLRYPLAGTANRDPGNSVEHAVAASAHTTRALVTSHAPEGERLLCN